MLILCVYGLWERSKLVGAGLTVLVVSLVSLAIVMRDKKPVRNSLIQSSAELLFDLA